MTGKTEARKPDWSCQLCDDTGYKDYAGFAMDPCDHGGAATSESGWLIEEQGARFIHWVALGKGCWPRTTRSSHPFRSDRYVSPVEFVKDSNDALRFARKQDAEAFVAMFRAFLLNPIVTEHEWPRSAAEPDRLLQDLLEACERMVAATEADQHFIGEEHDAMKAAIAKARGSHAS